MSVCGQVSYSAPPDDHLLMDLFPSLVDTIDVFHVKEEWFVKHKKKICCLFLFCSLLVSSLLFLSISFFPVGFMMWK